MRDFHARCVKLTHSQTGNGRFRPHTQREWP